MGWPKWRRGALPDGPYSNSSHRCAQNPKTTGSERPRTDFSVEKRWTKSLASPFCAVSSYFLANYTRLRPHENARGLNSTEAMLIIQLVDYKWDEAAPFPSLGTIARRMGLSTRQVRDTVKRLEGLGYLKRVPRLYGGSNAIELSGLFTALEQLQAQDAERVDAAAANVEVTS